MESIFEQIVRHENDHTNLLRNILDRYPNAAAVILTYLLGTHKSALGASEYQYTTQSQFYSDDGRAIPDIHVEGLAFRCLIEVKVSLTVPFTKAQLEKYASCFQSGSDNHLCYLVPAGRPDCLGQDEDSKDANGTQIHYRDWATLIKQLREKLEPLPDAVLLEAIAFWERAFDVVKMTEDHMSFLSAWNGDNYIAMRRLEQTVDQARKLFDLHFEADGEFETEGDTAAVSEYGFYLKRRKRYEVWVGIWAEVNSPAPLLFGFVQNRPIWRYPRPRPMPDLTFKNMDLWRLGPETWGDPAKLFETVKAFTEGLTYYD